MQSEITKNQQPPQVIHQIPAGMLPQDKSLEIFADRKTKEVFFVQSGNVEAFENLPKTLKIQLFERMLKDDQAMHDLRHLGFEAAIKIYAFCVYGSADHVPDFTKAGILQKGDNFRCSDNCKCLRWSSKILSFNGKTLTGKQIQVIDLIRTGIPDKAIASELHISIPTLNFHKKKLFDVFEVDSKTQLMVEVIKAKIVQ